MIWNLPASSYIKANISYGFEVADPQEARQGIAYGWHRYAGPKPPLGQNHKYRFTIYSLDCSLNLNRWTRKKQTFKSSGRSCPAKGTTNGFFWQ